MIDSVILHTPVLWIGFTIALILCLIGLVWSKTGYILPILSVVATTVFVVLSFLFGASYMEVGSVVLLFLCLNLISYAIKGGKR